MLRSASLLLLPGTCRRELPKILLTILGKCGRALVIFVTVLHVACIPRTLASDYTLRFSRDIQSIGGLILEATLIKSTGFGLYPNLSVI